MKGSGRVVIEMAEGWSITVDHRGLKSMRQTASENKSGKCTRGPVTVFCDLPMRTWTVLQAVAGPLFRYAVKARTKRDAIRQAQRIHHRETHEWIGSHTWKAMAIDSK